MSGRLQHYLPQFLQRNLNFRVRGDECYVHAHTRAKSFETNTSGIGKQRDFYGHPNMSTGDANVTHAETPLVETVKRLITSDGPVTQREFATLVASISLRTKKMREALKEASPKILSAFALATNQRGRAEREFDKLLSNKVRLDELVETEIAKQSLDRNQLAKARVRARGILATNARSQRYKILTETQFVFSRAMEGLVAEASKIADNAFVGIFERDAVPAARISMFESFEYSLVSPSGPEGFVLGDCGVVAIQSDGRPKLALGNVNEDLVMAEVWLPIAPQTAVLGRRPDVESSIDATHVNQMSAKLSQEFFISDVRASKHIQELKLLIGTQEPLLTSDEIDALTAFK